MPLWHQLLKLLTLTAEVPYLRLFFLLFSLFLNMVELTAELQSPEPPLHTPLEEHNLLLRRENRISSTYTGDRNAEIEGIKDFQIHSRVGPRAGCSLRASPLPQLLSTWTRPPAPTSLFCLREQEPCEDRRQLWFG